MARSMLGIGLALYPASPHSFFRSCEKKLAHSFHSHEKSWPGYEDIAIVLALDQLGDFRLGEAFVISCDHFRPSLLP